mgnify:CR=1 FL=1|tara:strand:+ start:830 stop:1198 length:369 start_codon:yes stop_codon:yes gene_type:complete
MNIFFKHTETRPMGHSSLINDLAWCGHNERISNLERYKDNMKKMIESNNSFKKVNEKAIRYYDWLIKICNKYKDQPPITEDWLNKYLKRKYPKNVLGGVLGIKGKIYPTTKDYYKLLKKTNK